MPDPRFFEDLEPATLGELAGITGAVLTRPEAGGQAVLAVAILSQARADTITFLSDRRFAPDLASSQAGACFVSQKDQDMVPATCVALLTPNPQVAYALAAQRLHRARPNGDQAVAASAVVEEGVHLGFGVVVGPGAHIGRGTIIGPNTVIGPGVAIGRDCHISANVTIGFALVGDRVRILAGAVIGEAGFGAAAGPKGLVDIPQFGRVILQDAVTIGANTAVDRGAFDDTVIGENTKIDNQVQIAHNVRIGRNCAIAAHCGVSGSSVIGDGVQFGGRAGVSDHLTVGDGARLAASAGVIHDIPAGETWGGFPARPIRRWMRETAWLSKMASRREGGEK